MVKAAIVSVLWHNLPNMRRSMTRSRFNLAALALTMMIAGTAGYYLLYGSHASTAPSRGVYVADFFSSPTAANLANSNIDGFFQGYKWNLCEPSAGVYKWTSAGCPLNSDLTAIKNAGKQVALGIDTGSDTPSWAEPQSLSFIISPHDGMFGKCHNDVIPIPWDPTYQHNLQDMINSLSAYLKSAGLYDTVSQVKLTGITEDTEETRMPAETPKACTESDVTPSIQTSLTNAPALWAQNGYTQARVEGAWETMAGYWASAFPDKTLGNPTIQSNGFPNIVNGVVQSGNATTTQDLVTYGAHQWGSRYLTMENALSDTSNEPMAAYATSNHLTLSIGFQLEDIRYGPAAAANGIHEPLEPAFTNAVSHGISLGMSYLEIFTNDPADYAAGVAYAHSKLSPAPSACPTGQTGTPPNCTTPGSKTTSPTTTPTACSACSKATSSANGTTAETTGISVQAGSNSIVDLAPPAGTDLSQVVKVTYAVDGKVIATVTVPPFGYDYDTELLKGGCHTLTTIVYDKNGSSTTSSKNLCVQGAKSWYKQPALWILTAIILIGLGGLVYYSLRSPRWWKRLLNRPN